MKVDWSRHARGVRLFAGARAFAGEDRGPTFVAGLEIDPSLLFPDYSRQRWMGDQPTDTVWTWWLGAGGGARELGSGAGPVRPVALLRVGFGVALTSAAVGRYHEIHLGPWAQAEGDLGGALGEGGLELAMTKERYDGRFYALRAGAGYGVGPSDRGAAISGSLLFGLRHVWGRCAPSYHARSVRAFATVRYWPVEGRGIAIVAGVELDPSLLLPSDENLWDPLTGPSNTGCERPL